MNNKKGQIAVIGMAGRFPGADSISEFWKNICDGKESISPLSDDDLRKSGVSESDIEDKSYIKVASTISDIDKFDPAFFKIPPVEAELMDPQIRLLLQCAWETLEDAGHATKNPQNIGVFAGMGGISTNYYSNFVNVSSQLERTTASPTHLGNDKDYLSTYISYKLNLTGPSMTIQTACSTSLVTVHQACMSLFNNECDMALAGGANIRIPHFQGYHYKKGHIFSKTGHIRSFDESADGVVFGSGYGLVLLKRFEDAIRDGNHIYAIVKGTAISNDGKDKISYAAASLKGQQRCIDAALKKAQVDATTIGFVESHGTGTYMGDPIEIAALSKAFSQNTLDTDAKSYCALGAVKANIGHLDAASGIAGFIKAVLTVYHGVIPPIVNYNRPNERINFETNQFYVNNTLAKWEDSNEPRRAGVNSVGIGGTNAFAVLEEHVAEKVSRERHVMNPADHVIVPLSAKTKASLIRYVQKLRNYISTPAGIREDIDIADLSYTLQVGREAMEYRVAFVVSSVAELKNSLVSFIEDKKDIADSSIHWHQKENENIVDLFKSNANQKEVIQNYINGRSWGELAELWVDGLNLDWNDLYGEARSKRISLPTYSFEKERYWIETEQLDSAAFTTAILHPLLHINTSDLSQQRYSSTFTGEEFFLKDHQLLGQKILPGVAYLEMARASIERGLPPESKSTILELHNIVWIQPIVVAGNKQVTTALFVNDNEQIDYEVYTTESDKEIIHCQGQAVFSDQPGLVKLDIPRLKDQMVKGRFEASGLYSVFNDMGLQYGPAHQGIRTIFLGEQQLIAQLSLPSIIETSKDDFLLHPSLLDGALQTSIGLIEDLNQPSGQPSLPFALDTLRIISPCTKEMIVWARYSPGSKPEDKIWKLDIDLCDQDGNVCVQMHGFSSRVRSGNISVVNNHDKSFGTLFATPVWESRPQPEWSRSTPSIYSQHWVILCEMAGVGSKEVETLISNSRCLLLQTAQKNIAERYSEYALRCFDLVQEILKGKPGGQVLIQLIVSNQQEATLFAGLSGLFKTASLENPQLHGQIIVTSAQVTAGQLAKQLGECQTRPQESIIKYDEGTRYVLGWKEIELSTTPRIVFKDHGTYLITGGLGGLGILFAKEILRQTKKASIILTGRSALSAEKRSVLDQLAAGSARVVYKELDIVNLDEVKQLIFTIKRDHKTLHGILHCAGMISDNFILKKTSEEFVKVLSPKVTGTFNLDEASKETDLDFMVLFSSVASSLGNVGQSDYASANGFMDQFSFYRNQLVAIKQRQGKTVSVNWPLWKEGGMGTDEASQAMLKEAMGMHPMQTQTGLEVFYRSLELQHGQTLVMEGDVQQMRNALPGSQKNQSAPLRTGQLPAREVDSDSLREQTEEYLRKQFSALLKLPSHKIDTRAALERYGIDSILAINLTNQLEKTFGNLSKTLFFEYQTIGELADYFIKSHGDQLSTLFATAADGEAKPADTASASSSSLSMRAKAIGRRRYMGQSQVKPLAQTPSTRASKLKDTDPIAIIGLSGRYPEAINIEEYWRNLRDGKDCIIEVPKDRWDLREYYSEDRTKEGHHYSKWGGFISGVDEFDPRFFNISPREAQSIDPQERLFLQHAWMAIEDAGYTRKALQIPQENDLAGQVGVYVGVMWSEYQLFGAQASMEGKRIGLAGNLSSIANRVSYFLNLHGPSMAVDTMCSSSLTAIHLACQDLQQGRTSLAIAGGVNVSIHPNKYLMLSAGQFISSDGHCQSFGEGGDGYIPGEGVGAVVLKRLSEAERDGDHIYGIIQGSSLNHGGKTNGFSVPNPHAQAGAIHGALSESNLNARHISYIEAHGTGTKLGDPIEIAALSKAFHHYTADTGFCSIGSAKSNIGHCESAAGIAGLTKVLLQMQHQQIVPSLHSTKLNPHIDFQKTPFVVNQTLRKWEQPVIDGKVQPRIAGISSFGAGGSNAHIILQEYLSSTETERSASFVGSNIKVIIPLSARTPEQLQQKALDLLNFIRSFREQEQVSPSGKRLDLFAMAYSLQVGREAMAERLGFVISSIDQLAEKLQAYIQGEQDLEDVYQGQVKSSKEGMTVLSEDDDMAEAIDKWMARKKLSKLLDLWVKGFELDWNKLYADDKPNRISLPTYPFARERYWVEAAPRERQAVTAKATAILHPLLHENTSDLLQQSYSSGFRGDEFFLTDTQGIVDGAPAQKILPAETHLEMARAAVERSLPAGEESGIVELRNVVWGDPFVISGNEKISIALFAKDNDSVEYEIYSKSKDEEIVHCQGQAIFSVAPQSGKVDVDQLKGQMSRGKVSVPDQGIVSIYQGEQQLLAQLRLLPDVEESQGEYQLHPGMLAGAFQASAVLVEGLSQDSSLPSLPLSVTSVRIVSSCTKEMFCWARYSPGSSAEDTVTKVDIDLYDEHGNECVQLRGVHYQQESVSGVKLISRQVSDEPPTAVSFVAPRKIFSAPLTSQKIRVPDSASSTFQPAGLKKPVGISLSSPQALTSEKKPQVSLLKGTVTLSKGTLPFLPEESESSGRTGSVDVYDHGQGIYSIQIASANNNTLSQDLTRQLLQALGRIEQEGLVRVLILSGTADGFLSGGRQEYNEAVSQKLYQAITSFPYPVIAAMQGDATGSGFLVGALCDFMICSREGKYYYTSPQEGLYPGEEEYQFFKERLGEVRAADFLYHSTGSTGKRLQEKGWTNPVLPQDQVEAYAQKLASSLAKKSESSLRLLKQHLSRHLISLVNALPTVTPLPEKRSEEASVKIISPAKHIRLTTPEGSVLVIRLCVSEEAYGTKALTSDLINIFSQVNSCTQYKTIVLSSEHANFLPGTEQESVASAVLEMQDIVLECKVPVLCILDSDTEGMGWFVSQFCDGCIYHAQGRYSFTNSWQKAGLAKAAPMIFTHRFGSSLGKEIVLTGKSYTGFELQQRVGTITTAPADKLLPVALQWAALWSKLPWDTVVEWKKQMVLRVREKIKALPEWSETESASIKPPSSKPVSISLRSKVMMATAHPEGILEVRMEDREAKNMFSDAFIEGITEVFEHVEQSAEYKVVILSGYDTYFASGGTKESLLSIQEGKTRFTDAKIYHLAMACKVPVISAMQGHGIGAGWALGMFADFILFSEESKYVSPYMNYGFTPGAGATFIFPERIGYDLSRETLLTAQEYSGIDLKERGLQLPVLPRGEVQATAFALAQQIANSPRSRLVSIKHQLTHLLYKPLEEAYEHELAMHEKTFVGQQETLQQIENNFYQERGSYAEMNGGERSTQSVPADTTPGADNLAGIMTSLKKLLAHELRIGEHEINEDIQFVDLGLDSITGVTWIRKINEKYKTSIEATQVYSYPTLAQLSRHVKEEAEKQGTVLSNTETDKLVTPVKPQPSISSPKKIASPSGVKKLSSFRHQRTSRMIADASSTHPREAIAVIGMAGQFPQAKNVEEFWRNISQGKNCITEIPQKRWDHSLYYREGGAEPGKANSKWMGALEEYDLFDPLFFNISPKEAISMDPQQRIFLQTCWHSLEHAGYNPKSLSGSKCGVFVGCGTGDYHQLSREHQLSAQGFTGSSASILAGRVSYFLNLQGPCLSIETACSSSLVAISTACDSLNSGSSDVALAGGVYVMSGPQMHIKCSQSGMLSVDGRCFTFDQRANGFVPGEGVGVVVLKRLSDAERDHDMIYGVIQGWGVNQDGQTNGITAPNAESQTRLEQEVYDKFRIDPANIQLVEAHGTGTKLGDPIEVRALKETFQKYTRKKNYCALTSVKSNIGHCLTAAGVASFIKTLQALNHKQLPPTINFNELNEHIGLQDSPFYINSQLQKWELKETDRRQAAISSFGFSGTNAHVVVSEYVSPPEAKQAVSVITQNGKVIVPLSARTVEQLKQKAIDLLDFIGKEGSSLDLIQMAYTLQVGREAMEERLGFMVSSIAQLTAKLQAYINEVPDIEEVCQGQVKRSKEGISIISQDAEVKEILIGEYITKKKLSNLLNLWVKGLDFDWNKLYGEVKPQRISLPIYPFVKERYWIEATETVELAKTGTASSVLHPLLHKNTSDLKQHRYSSTFSGTEFFLTSQQIQTIGDRGQKIIPPMVCLEMIRAAAEQAMPGSRESSILELHNIVWAHPIVISGREHVHVALIENDNDQVNYEIYSTQAGQEIIHCQGLAIFIRRSPTAKRDIAQLKGQMGLGKLEASGLYQSFSRMGFHYGPAYQGIVTVYKGENQLLAKLCIPAVIGTTQNDYMLHPSLMESILQACVCFSDLNQFPNQPIVPTSLDSIRIVSACTKEMVAWVRYSGDSQPEATTTKLDIDLYDPQGNICVEVQGLSLKQLTSHSTQQADIQSFKSIGPVRSLSATSQLPLVKLDDSQEMRAIGNGKEGRPGISMEHLFNEPFHSNAGSFVNPQPSDESEEFMSQEELQQQLRISLGEALCMKRSDVDVDKPFIELGLDSIIGVEWVSTINRKFNINITATKVYEHPTIRNLAQFVREKYFTSSSGTVKPQGESSLNLRAIPAAENGKNGKHDVSPSDFAQQPFNSHSDLLVNLEPSTMPEESIPQEQLQQQLKFSLGEILCMKTSDIDIDRPFIELGLDSIIGVEWVSTINKKFNINITATKVYEHPTITSLTHFIKERYFADKQNGVKRDMPAAPLTKHPVGLLETPETTVLSIRHSARQKFATTKSTTPLLALHCPIGERRKQWIQAGEQYGFVLRKPTASLDDVGFQAWTPPVIAAHEMRIQVKASAINFPDTMCVSGLYPTMPDYPFVPGFEISGIVAEVGNQVTRFKIGDPVIALTGKAMGGHASFVNVSECDTAHKPGNISFEEACSLPVVFATVQYAFELAKLGYGESVLIHTATGGIGLMALQLAALRGAIPYATTSKHEKAVVLKKLGVSHILNYLSDFDKEIIDLTHNRGVDVVLNMLSGNGIQKGLNSLAPSGRYLEIAVHALKTSQKLDLSTLVKNQSIYSIDLRRLIDSQESEFSMSQLLEAMKNLLESKQIVPIVSRIYPVHQIADALQYVSKGQHVGKVVISHSADTMTDLTDVCIDNLINQRNQALNGQRSIQYSRAISSSSVTDKTQPIAVIGMAGQFPQAKNVEEFWQNIAQGKNCISEIPQSRWDINSIFNEEIGVPGKTNSKWMGALEEYDLFDPLFFNISPIEAERMDPQQRVFLQACWHAIENAGYNAKSLSGSKCGVFAGCGAGDYYRISPEQQLNAHGLMGSVISILAARISYFLNLQGPCLSIDTACSSSLVAIAEACESLTSGNSDLALAGGVTIFSGPSMQIMTSQSGMLSPDGRCYSFDQRANGFVAAEGVGVVMLKRLADAEKDQDIIYGVIQGWGVNQDGKTNGITAPNPESQTRLQQEVYDKYNIDPSDIQLIEAHGTGTKLGDPIEVEGLKESFKKYTWKKGYCALTSVKSNIGHGLAAAGVSGFIKLLMALKHKQLPPTINFNKLNEHIDLENSPFYINDTLQDWKVVESERRRAAVSSFGFSGTNAHLVLAEYLPIKEVKPAVSVVAKKVIVPLSARTAEQLKQRVRDLLNFIRKEAQSIDLIEVAYTLQVGREAMEERLGFIVSSVEHLAEKLQAYLDGNENIEDAYYGQVKRNQDIFAAFCEDEDMQKVFGQWVLNKKLSRVLDIWVKGLEFDWNKLYGEVRPGRIALPEYPFAKERYWINTDPGREATIETTTAVLHPLLHLNTSDITQQRYSSTFHGEEFFLKDHQLQGQKVLPGVAYLEMARASIEKGVPDQHKSGILELRNTVWLNPLAVEGNRHVSIVLCDNNEAGTSIDQIDYEIYSDGNKEKTVHCQGQAFFGLNPVPAKIDLARLKEQMRREIINGPSLYATLTRMGLNYGPAFQGVISIFLGENQLVADLRLPSVIASCNGKSNPDDLILHPSLMDSALQSSIALVADLNHIPSKPFVPFALESVRIVSACTTEMFSWIRYSPGSKPEDKLVKLDIDLCDHEGNVCVQMRGFTYRVLNNEMRSTHQSTINNSMDDNRVVVENSSPFDASYYQNLIERVINNEVTIDEAANLG